jgi:hypothetical protein
MLRCFRDRAVDKSPRWILVSGKDVIKASPGVALCDVKEEFRKRFGDKLKFVRVYGTDPVLNSAAVEGILFRQRSGIKEPENV